MPKKTEKALKREARDKGLKGEKADAYVKGSAGKKRRKPKKAKR